MCYGCDGRHCDFAMSDTLSWRAAMTSELQEIIDDLAQRLHSPTVLEDHDERIVVYSSHSQPIDEVRRDSILRRTTRPEVMAWFRDHGILGATEPMRIPGQPDLGILGRLCVPVRHQGRLMGWMFLIDDDQRLSDTEIALARRAARHAALLLYDEELSVRLTSGLLSHLLSRSEDLREAAAAQIADQGLMPFRTPCVVAVIQPLGLAEGVALECVKEALRDAALDGDLGSGQAVPGRQALRLGYADQGVVLVRTRTPEDDRPGIAVAQEVTTALRHRIGDDNPARVVAAVGDPQPRLMDAHQSYRQARLAIKVAAAVPTAGVVTRWRDLGVFRTLAQLPEPAVELAIDPRLMTLFAAGDPALVSTLEVYLDLGCDVKAASARLHLHRATLYYRLEKAQRLTGANLRDGNDRLAIHLSFKLARLAGLHSCPNGLVPSEQMSESLR